MPDRFEIFFTTDDYLKTAKLVSCLQCVFRKSEIEHESSEHLFMHPVYRFGFRPHTCISYKPPAKNNPMAGRVIKFVIFYSINFPLHLTDQSLDFLLKYQMTERHHYSD